MEIWETLMLRVNLLTCPWQWFLTFFPSQKKASFNSRRHPITRWPDFASQRLIAVATQAQLQNWPSSGSSSVAKYIRSLTLRGNVTT